VRRFSDLLQLILGSYDQSLDNMSLLRNMRQLFLVAVNWRPQNTSLFRDMQPLVIVPYDQSLETARLRSDLQQLFCVGGSWNRENVSLLIDPHQLFVVRYNQGIQTVRLLSMEIATCLDFHVESSGCAAITLWAMSAAGIYRHVS